MSSSSRLSKTDDIALEKLTALKSCCESYQYKLLRLMMTNKDFLNGHPSFVPILNALDYERTVAGNLAGLLDIQMNGYVVIGKTNRVPLWSLGDRDFVKALDPVIKVQISDALNSLQKQNFSETDLVMIMEQVLSSHINEKTTGFLGQYKIMIHIKKLIVEYVENTDINARDTLLKIQEYIDKNKNLLENLTLAPAHRSFFSKPRTFLSEAQELLGVQSKSRVHNRAS